MFTFFQRIDDYSKMLVRIATSAFFVSLLAVWIVRLNITEIDRFFGKFSLSVPVMGVGIPLDNVLVALLVLIFFRMVRLHDRISDILGIRRSFDINLILMPLAVGSGVSLSREQMRKIEANRRKLMGKVFYKYASSAEKAVIDRHLIVDALDYWGWLWCLVESIVIAGMVAATAAWFHNFPLMAWTLASIWPLLFFAFFISQQCRDAAEREVDEILTDDARCVEIRREFSAL
jgi:hypothetical protein